VLIALVRVLAHRRERDHVKNYRKDYWEALLRKELERLLAGEGVTAVTANSRAGDYNPRLLASMAIAH
jgi:hypothetical protein